MKKIYKKSDMIGVAAPVLYLKFPETSPTIKMPAETGYPLLISTYSGENVTAQVYVDEARTKLATIQEIRDVAFNGGLFDISTAVGAGEGAKSYIRPDCIIDQNSGDEAAIVLAFHACIGEGLLIIRVVVTAE